METTGMETTGMETTETLNNDNVRTTSTNTANTNTATAVHTGSLHEFKPGMTYQFGAISRNDIENQNYNTPSFERKKYPIIKTGEWFTVRGFRTISDFLQRGTDDKGKPFPPSATFVFQIMIDPATAETIHVGQFAEQPRQITPVVDATQAPVIMQRKKRFSFASPALLNDAMGQVAQTLTAQNQETVKILQHEITRLRAREADLLKENAALKALNIQFEETVRRLTIDNEQYKTTLETRKQDLEREYQTKTAALESMKATLEKAEKERSNLELELKVQQAVEAARKDWEQEREEEEATLRDELREEIDASYEHDLQEVMRDLDKREEELEKREKKLNKKREKWQKKQGLADRGAAWIAKKTETDEGQMLLSMGQQILGGLMDIGLQKFAPERYELVQMSLAQSKAQLQAQMQAQQNGHAPPPPAPPPPPPRPSASNVYPIPADDPLVPTYTDDDDDDDDDE